MRPTLLLAKNSWACVTLTDVVAADPDVMIVVAAAFDPAIEKIDFMHNHSLFCSAAGSSFPPLAVPQLGSCSSSGRAWRLRAVERPGESVPLGDQPLPRVLELAPPFTNR